MQQVFEFGKGRTVIGFSTDAARQATQGILTSNTGAGYITLERLPDAYKSVGVGEDVSPDVLFEMDIADATILKFEDAEVARMIYDIMTTPTVSS